MRQVNQAAGKRGRRADNPAASPCSMAIGRAVAEIGGSLVLLAQLFGALTMAMRGARSHARRGLRLTSMVHHLDRVGWRAVPIILL